MFPTMNAQSVTKRFAGATGPSTTTVIGNIATGPHNLLSVPAVVDVSGMEYSLGVAHDGLGVAGLSEASVAASQAAIALSDGGPSGDNTTVAILAAVLVPATASPFIDSVPQDVTGTSTTDLDADDWVNFHVTVQPTTITGVGAADVALAYIYGKPGSIN